MDGSGLTWRTAPEAAEYQELTCQKLFRTSQMSAEQSGNRPQNLLFENSLCGELCDQSENGFFLRVELSE